MNTRFAVATAAVALLLAGCSASDTEASTVAALVSTSSTEATPSAESTVTPSPSVAGLTKEQAGQQYLDLVEPVNDIIDGNEETWTTAFNANDWQTLSTLAATHLEAERTFVEGLIDASWPDDVAPVVDEIVSQSSTEMAWYSGLSSATNEAEFWAAWDTGGEFDRSAAQELRVRLGLDNVDS